MKIGGLQPVTLLDYPEKLAAIIFTAGCNMRCPFCYNFNLVLPEQFSSKRLYDENEVIEFLKKRKKYLEGLVISGGEPTFQEDLPEFLAKMKKIGYAVKLDTNGFRPEVLQQLIENKLVDYLAMDIKGSLEDYERFTEVPAGRIDESIKIVMASGLPYEFRSTLVKGLHEGADIIKMAQAIKGAEKYYLQNFSEAPVLAGEKFKGKAFFKKELEEMRQLAEKYVKCCEVR
jgi:pyruvate formate lyase activating enzyme